MGRGPGPLGWAASLLVIASALVVATDGVVQGTGTGAWIDTPGPAGGVVFYYNASGFSCGVGLSDTCHYLEVAGADWDSKNRRWSSTNGAVAGTSKGIGTGEKNTALIVASAPALGYAATDADSFTSDTGHSDWFLPSLNEAIAMDSATYSTNYSEVGTSSQVSNSIWWSYDSRLNRSIPDTPKSEPRKFW